MAVWARQAVRRVLQGARALTGAGHGGAGESEGKVRYASADGWHILSGRARRSCGATPRASIAFLAAPVICPRPREIVVPWSRNLRLVSMRNSFVVYGGLNVGLVG